ISVRCSSWETAACVISRVLASCCCVRWRAARSSCSGISLRSWSARRRASARASGDIFARSSLNFVVFGIVFLLDLGKVVVVKLICQRSVFLVPAVIASFIAAQQQKRDAARIEYVEHPVGAPLVLHAQLTHSGMARADYPAAVRKWEMGPRSSNSKTALSTDMCSPSVRPFHQALNSSVTSTSHATIKL